MDIMETIKQQVEGAPVVLYMKGTPQFPMCGFSARVV
ncbi:MAG TPA: monothiol glutaredoxin, Grx4 family, partial [Candidatus Tenderia electrophaga]|nr:monothiol glutaredoxin, Grx4 family [Candidatus Tenderia electrophaga]